MRNVAELYLESATFRFHAIKNLGDGALVQLGEDELRWAPDTESTSIAIIVQHLHGNMLSRWTDFLTTDGEKSWRERDEEFVAHPNASKEVLLAKWEEGWACVFATFDVLTPEDLGRDIAIRGQSLSALDAIQRQIAHYGYHVGQITWIARHLKGDAWQTLSIAKGQSRDYAPEPGGRD